MFELRPVRPKDAELVAGHRQRMFLESGWDAEAVKAMRAAFDPWIAAALADGSYGGWVSETAGQAVGAIGFMRIAWPPHPGHPGDPARGYILNLFVEPGWRGRGCASQLIGAAEASLAARGCTYLVLHATAAGRPLYDTLGWQSGTEMFKRLRPAGSAR